MSRRAAALLAGAALFAGCAVTPRYERPPVELPAAWRAQGAAAAAGAPPPPPPPGWAPITGPPPHPPGPRPGGGARRAPPRRPARPP